MASSRLVFTVLLLYSVRTSAIGGADQPITVEIDIVCDKACYELIQYRGYDPEVFLYDVSKEADERMATLNTSVVLVAMEIWNYRDEIPVYSTLDEVRVEFSKYRLDKLLHRKWSDASILVTGREVSGVPNDPNGVMPLSSCCTNHNGAGVLKYSIQTAASLSATLVHELGHAVGINHDIEGCCSAGQYKCIMSTVYDSSHVYAPMFSDCSKVEFEDFMAEPQSACLMDEPYKPLVPSGGDSCGNGVLDQGEECDCGGGCLFGCCNCCQQCMLVPGAVCYHGNCCDTTGSCQLHPQGHVCRVSAHAQCDVVDTCSGDSHVCDDVTNQDGAVCNDDLNEAGYCRTGKCLTKNEQCKSEWGSEIFNGEDICYTTGITSPSWFVNCGIQSNGYFIPCTESGQKNYRCGMLQCTGTSDKSTLSLYKDPQINYFVQDVDCISGKYGDWQEKTGAILVANGSRCGDNRACYNGDCLPLDFVLNVTSHVDEPEEVYICGDGVVDPGEQCDCGPYQCNCCHPDSCQFLAAGSAGFYDNCTLCDGVSPDSTEAPSSDFTECDSGQGHCYDGKCRSLRNSCRRLFGDEAEPADPEIYKQNLDEMISQHNGGGYILYDVTTSSWSSTYREFLASEEDGRCGLILCVSSNVAVVKDNNGRTLESKTFYLRYDDTIRVAYYTFETTTNSGRTYQRYHPVLTDIGTPCTTASGAAGYCDPELLQLDQWGWNWYWYSICVPVNI